MGLLNLWRAVAVALGLIVVVVLCESRAFTADVEAPQLSGKLGTPIQLFNGKDLEGWVWYQRPPREGKNDPAVVKLEDVWSVEDGILKSKGKPNGYLRTNKDFKNFVLTVEERHV